MKIIGIDPAFRESGFGVCILTDREATFPKVRSFIDFFRFASEIPPDGQTVFVVENSNLQNATFAGYKANARQLQRISRNVGANQAVSQMSVDYLRHLGHLVIEVSPLAKGAKLNQKAITYIAKAEGIEIPSKLSQDDRDAFKLAIQQKNAKKAGF